MTILHALTFNKHTIPMYVELTVLRLTRNGYPCSVQRAAKVQRHRTLVRDFDE